LSNLPVPFDRRVWQEATALRRAGWGVSVICPRNAVYPLAFEEIDGIAIYRHSLPVEAEGFWGFTIEYIFALFHEFRLLLKIWRGRGFSVIQACNPPDLIFLVALPFKLLGVRFVYDQHDLAPLLYVAKFGHEGALYRMLCLFERLSLYFADHAFFANDTFKEIAVERGLIRAALTESVYSIPDRTLIFATEPDERLRNGRQFVLGYVGIIGAQDGLDQLIRAVAYVIHEEKFTDFQAVIVGDGPALEQIRALAAELDISQNVTFAGYQVGDMLRRHLSAFDIGVIPDPVNPTNDKMSMNKVFEYCMLGLAISSYPLRETKRLLGDAAVYAETNDAVGLGRACLKLMRDDGLRARCAAKARQLAEGSFVWDLEARKYVNGYERLCPRPSTLKAVELCD
jgi:glycosyltransferase involved in cell wall biosynthesis